MWVKSGINHYIVNRLLVKPAPEALAFLIAFRNRKPTVKQGVARQSQYVYAIDRFERSRIVRIRCGDDDSAPSGHKRFGDAFSVGFNAPDVGFVQRRENAYARLSCRAVINVGRRSNIGHGSPCDCGCILSDSQLINYTHTMTFWS